MEYFFSLPPDDSEPELLSVCVCVPGTSEEAVGTVSMGQAGQELEDPVQPVTHIPTLPQRHMEIMFSGASLEVLPAFARRQDPEPSLANRCARIRIIPNSDLQHWFK